MSQIVTTSQISKTSPPTYQCSSTHPLPTPLTTPPTHYTPHQPTHSPHPSLTTHLITSLTHHTPHHTTHSPHPSTHPLTTPLITPPTHYTSHHTTHSPHPSVKPTHHSSLPHPLTQTEECLLEVHIAGGILKEGADGTVARGRRVQN